jgi:hypothetical protein
MAGTDIVADRSRRSRGWTQIFIGIPFMLIGGAVSSTVLFVAGGVEAATGSGPGPGGLIAGVVGGIFALAGLGSEVAGVRNLWRAHVLGTQTLTVPPAEPLFLGGLLVARFHRRGGTRRARQSATLSAELVCTESVTYVQGTDSHTVTEDVYRCPLPLTPEGLPDTVSARIVIEVPVEAPPSMKLSHNRILWTVQVTVKAPGFPDDVGTFPVPVVPAVAPRAIPGGSEGLR